MPPETVIAPELKATPLRPSSRPRRRPRGTGLIVMGQAVLVAPLASVTLTEKVPEAVGVPVTAPVVVFRFRPARQRAHDGVGVRSRSSGDRHRAGVEGNAHFAGRDGRAGNRERRVDRDGAGRARRAVRVRGLDRECTGSVGVPVTRACCGVQGQAGRQRAHDRVRVRERCRPRLSSGRS